MDKIVFTPKRIISQMRGFDNQKFIYYT